MSLKAFHIVFISVSVMLLLFLAGWCFSRPEGGTMSMVWGSLSLVTAAALAVYGKRFLKRLKHISFL